MLRCQPVADAERSALAAVALAPGDVRAVLPRDLAGPVAAAVVHDDRFDREAACARRDAREHAADARGLVERRDHDRHGRQAQLLGDPRGSGGSPRRPPDPPPRRRARNRGSSACSIAGQDSHDCRPRPSAPIPCLRVRTLITGGCGFVGANLVPMLLERGCELRILDNFSLGDRGRVRRAGGRDPGRRRPRRRRRRAGGRGHRGGDPSRRVRQRRRLGRRPCARTST